MLSHPNPARKKLESLFNEKHRVTPKPPDTQKSPPLRPCGCRTWFTGNDVCPYCGKRIVRAVLNAKIG